MKKVFVSICLLSVVHWAIAQMADSSLFRTPEDWLQKSNHQKTGGWLLAGAGGAILFITVIKSALSGLDNNPPPFPVVPVIIGSGSFVGGIVLFSASARNRKKARNLSVELIMQKATVAKINILGSKNFPALSLRMKL